ncbi:Crp/Fnr family transcriptional regulator [Alicyclobacillus sp.]|uniref:Crp/Fnr family transcriptional regulator n=1 Tax=Alicyclobacillus sp. TaxID=61169 RepID=UPI0025C3D4FA|nr:Crp/Fnr family transcriptional regulator [Alicyclobacillus sp.]MCL6517209.1 Crp/Fnr family transcriptional regulator [Alicyclobacillus sp.]
MDTLQILREIELFRDLTDEELQRVQALAIERRYERGDYVFMEGDEREAVYFIRRGLIKIFKVDEEGREHIVTILGAGQMFPHVGFFQEGPYPGTAQAMERSVLFAIRTAAFDQLLVEYPDIARKVMRVMGQRILQLQAKLQELAVFDSRERVIALIRHFAEEHGEVRPDGVHLRLPVTHGEMAHMVGMTRESVNRIWNQLKRDGVLSGERDEWVVRLDKLRRA